MKAIRSLENTEIFLKGTTRKITSQEGGFLNFLRPLMTGGSPSIKNVLTALAKNDLLPFGLSAGTSAGDAAIQKNIYGSGVITKIISIEEIEGIVKMVKSFEESGPLVKGISEIIENETKEQKGGFLPWLLGTLAASLLGCALKGRGIIRAGQGVIRPGKNFNTNSNN